MSTFYKVLAISCNKFYSYGYTAGRQEYFENVWNYPSIHNSKLFVFAELKDAIAMLGVFYSKEVHTIWECEVENPTVCDNICCWMSPTETFEDFWKKPPLLRLPPPEGTYLVDSLRLIKEVDCIDQEGN